MMVGVIPWADLGIEAIATRFWWFPEMTASFLFFAIVIGVIGRMSEGRFTTAFVDGARDLLGVALIIGVARGITVIMNNGQITDTVLFWAEQAVSGLGGVAFINLMYGLFIPLSFLIPSSSGLATVAMPIMAPLASLADVAPELVVTAFQAGNGLVNLVNPTFAVVMGGLAIARVGYGTGSGSSGRCSSSSRSSRSSSCPCPSCSDVDPAGLTSAPSTVRGRVKGLPASFPYRRHNGSDDQNHRRGPAGRSRRRPFPSGR